MTLDRSKPAPGYYVRRSNTGLWFASVIPGHGATVHSTEAEAIAATWAAYDAEHAEAIADFAERAGARMQTVFGGLAPEWDPVMAELVKWLVEEGRNEDKRSPCVGAPRLGVAHRKSAQEKRKVHVITQNGSPRAATTAGIEEATRLAARMENAAIARDRHQAGRWRVFAFDDGEPHAEGEGVLPEKHSGA